LAEVFVNYFLLSNSFFNAFHFIVSSTEKKINSQSFFFWKKMGSIPVIILFNKLLFG